MNHGSISNRDRFFEKKSPLFKKSKFEIRKCTDGKYRDKKIEIINAYSGEHDFHIWCWTRNDRLDLLVPNWRIKQIPESFGLQDKCRNILYDQRLKGVDATSFQEVDEEVLVEICKYIAKELI